MQLIALGYEVVLNLIKKFLIFNFQRQCKQKILIKFFSCIVVETMQTMQNNALNFGPLIINYCKKSLFIT
jgi:hypothetical protein